MQDIPVIFVGCISSEKEHLFYTNKKRCVRMSYIADSIAAVLLYGHENSEAKYILKLENSMDHFELVSEYAPTGDQPEAIEGLVKGFQEGKKCQTLLGVKDIYDGKCHRQIK